MLQRARQHARRALRRGAWWRLVIPWAARREVRDIITLPYGTPWQGCDPWDARWLVSAGIPGRPIRGQRPRFDPGLLKRLSKWRPRRPTVLLLDDPLEGDAERVIAALLEADTLYRHPVRLLVVNQTVPTDLKIQGQSKSWRSDLRGFSGEVLKLGGEAALGHAEVRGMAGSLQLQMEAWYQKQPTRRQRIAWKPDTGSVDRLLRRTAGNALLVGLALYRIYHHPAQPEISRKALLQERVEQIVAALKVAGINDERMQAIAWATLAGPGAVLPAGTMTKDMRFDPDKLDAVPNLHAAPAPAPPLVQPEPIGDAFVQHVLSEERCATDRRQEVINLAWRAAPVAMLRTAWRLSTGEDALAGILREGPPPGAGLDELAIALAHVQWAVHIPRSDWDLGDVPGFAPFPHLLDGGVEAFPNFEDMERYAGLRTRASEALRLALERLQTLPPAAAAAGLIRFVSVMEVENTIAVVRGGAALACFLALVARGLEDETAWQDPEAAIESVDALTRFFVSLRQWGADPLQERNGGTPYALGDLLRRAEAALGSDRGGIRRAETLAEAVRHANGSPDAGATILSALAALAKPHGALGTARAHRFATVAAVLRNDTPAANEAASRVDDIARPFQGDREFERERAEAWRYVSRSP